MNWKIVILLTSVIAITYIVWMNTSLWFTNPDRDIYLVRGIDVSHHQGEINWKLVSNDDVTFAYIKATEANDFVDNNFITNWEEARKNKIHVGAYHFYSLAYSGDVQAQNFISVVPREDEQLPPVIDLEYVGNSKKRPSKSAFQNDLNTYILLINQYFDKEPIIYTTYNFYEDYLYPQFIDYDIWIRDIFSSPKTNIIGDWEIWQYNSRGRVEGILGPVDLNVLNQKSLLLP